MISIISKKMTNQLLKKEIITQEDYEIYLFGMNQLIVTLLDFLTCAVIGIFFGSLLQTTIFIIAFMGVRSYAGGYHASTPLRCYLLTTMMVILSVGILKYMEWNVYVLSGLLIFASIVILVLAPVDTENKPIDDIEYVYFRKKTKNAVAVEVALAAMCMVFHFGIVVEAIVWALVVMAVSLVGEKMKKRSE